MTHSVTPLTDSVLHTLQPRRSRSSHKGHYGHVLVVGGDYGMAGAARLAGEAAARAGSGLVSVATRTVHAAVIAMARPELMCHGVDRASDLRPLLQRASVVAIGPGLGQSAWGVDLLGAVLQTRLPLVVDADALNLLAQEPAMRDHWILTPHPAEAARLSGVTTEQVQADRPHAVQVLQQRYGGVCVLKGAGSLVCTSGSIAICDAGNPGMASGGMGDVLTGVIVGLLAQGLSLSDAAGAGVYIHARAGDRAAAQGGGERGLLAGDLMSHIRPLVNPD